jgi:hypothetical protein
MKKYLGLVSIFILIVSFLILQSLVGKQIGHLWVWIIGIGYGCAALASWFSSPGFWRKASAAILVVVPVGFILFLVSFVIGLKGGEF